MSDCKNKKKVLQVFWKHKYELQDNALCMESVYLNQWSFVNLRIIVFEWVWWKCANCHCFNNLEIIKATSDSTFHDSFKLICTCMRQQPPTELLTNILRQLPQPRAFY